MSRQTTVQNSHNKTPSKKAAFLRAADNLFRETVAVTAREKVFPKRSRWQFAYALMELANQFHSQVLYANGIHADTRELFADRYRAQTLGLASLYALNAKMSAAQLCMNINADLLECWARLYVEAWDKTTAWRAADRRRYEEKFGSLTAEELGSEPVLVSPGGPGRSPNPSNANNVRNTTPDGALNNNNANNANGGVADREKASIE